MCNELLDKIFGYLDLQNLLDVAGASEQLKITAATKFGQGFGNKTVCLNECSYNHFRLTQKVKRDKPGVYTQYNIEVIGLKVGLSFLRCFGANILKLRICYKDTRHEYLGQYVNQYCRNIARHHL